jgi:hypothetical protein
MIPKGYISGREAAPEKLVKQEKNIEAEIEELYKPVVAPTPITAGYMGIPNIAWIAIGGVAIYYAYSKGMLNKLIK